MILPFWTVPLVWGIAVLAVLSLVTLQPLILALVFTTTALPNSRALMEGLFSVDIATLTFSSGEILLAALLSSWVIHLFAGRKRIPRSSLLIPYAAFCFYLALRIEVSAWSGYSLKYAVEDSRLLWQYLVYFVVVSAFRPVQAKRLVQTFLLGLAVYSAVALGTRALGSDFLLWDYIYGAAYSRVGSQTDILYLLGIPLALSLLVTPIPRWEKAAYLCVLPFYALQVLSNGSRTLWIALALSLLILPLVTNLPSAKRLFLSKHMGTLLLAMITAAALSVLVSHLAAGSTSSAFWRDLSVRAQTFFMPAERERAIQVRLSDYGAAFSLIQEKPLFGQGMGTYVLLPRVMLSYSFIDNVWLTLGVKAGAVGVLLFAWIFLRFAIILGYVVRRLGLLSAPHCRAVVVALAVSWIGWILFSLNTAYLLEYQVVVVLFVFMGVVEVLRSEIQKAPQAAT
jgi:hypothetical protein